MASDSIDPGPGGFLPSVLLSPPPSSHASVTGQQQHVLPPTRSTPLKPASAKESTFIGYVDTKILGISRRYEKRFNTDLEDPSASKGDAEGKGYDDFGEMAKEIEAVIDVIWTSGTQLPASLQTPYFLSIALKVCTSIPSFPFAPRPTFQLLNKLDLAFVSLLRGNNAETHEPLSGFLHGRGKLSTTEKVRMKGLVEKTRVAVVEVAGKGMGSMTELESNDQTEEDYDMATETEDDIDEATESMRIDGNHGRWEMEIARVYERTIVELGMALETQVSEGFG